MNWMTVCWCDVWQLYPEKSGNYCRLQCLKRPTSHMTTSSSHPCCDAATSCKYFTSYFFICVISRRRVHITTTWREETEAGEVMWSICCSWDNAQKENKFQTSEMRHITALYYSRLAVLTCTHQGFDAHERGLDSQLSAMLAVLCNDAAHLHLLWFL